MGLFKKKEIAVVEKKEILPPVTEQTVTDYLKAFGHASNLLPGEVEAFKQMAIMHNLNPFNREIYCNAYGKGEYRTLSIVTGYEVYIRKAEQSGLLEYWFVEEAPPDIPIEKYWATLVVKRKDRVKEQKWIVWYAEAVQRTRQGGVNSFWKKQPRMMTKKVTMSQGFRLFFEDVMHGIPYTREEMPEDKGGLKNVTPTTAHISTSDNIMPKIKEEYEEEKEAVIELNLGRPDPEGYDQPKDAELPPSATSESVFAEIMKIVNSNSIKPMDKIKIMQTIRPIKDDQEQLAIVLKNVKNEFLGE